VNLHSKIEKFLTKKNFNFVHLETVDSTMTQIKKYIGNKNICMFADEQTEGIGRRGNKWISPKGNIYLSFLFNYNLSIQDHFIFTAITANSIINFLSMFINENINIKWPNDISINDSKIAGIITEIVEKNNTKYIIIGIGINIIKSPEISNYKTCCLKDYISSINSEDILLYMIQSYFKEYEMILGKRYNQIIHIFKKNMLYLNSKINILLPNGEIQNVLLKNINYDGSLLVEKQGIEEKIFSARII
tara:strand:+ start:825 stop:1565 length:741 start_codon:yes stop_codon:yes gene_type:complete